MMLKKIDFHVFGVMDSHNNTWGGILEDLADSIQVYGIRNVDGELLHFESDGYHLYTWCKDNALTLVDETHSTTIKIERR